VFLDNHQYSDWSINDSQMFDRGVTFPSIGSLRVSMHNCYFDDQKIGHDTDITTHDDFDSVDPSSMQDACRIWTQSDDLSLNELSKNSG